MKVGKIVLDTGAWNPTDPESTILQSIDLRANRDERKYPDPDPFDVTRGARDHLAFGHGAHRCAGSHLAQLEMDCLLRAMIARVRRIDVSEPRPLMRNMLHGYMGFDACFQ
jgi:cytochrome P450